MHIGLVGLGKMGGNMRERLREAGHTVIGFDTDSDLSDAESLAAMVELRACLQRRADVPHLTALANHIRGKVREQFGVDLVQEPIAF